MRCFPLLTATIGRGFGDVKRYFKKTGAISGDIHRKIAPQKIIPPHREVLMEYKTIRTNTA